MAITLEQARALDALAREGTYDRAARSLHKGRSALVHSVKMLGDQLGLELFDRTSYRSRLTPAGERVLRGCQRLLEAERLLEADAHVLRTGWEARLRIVSDGVVPPGPLVDSVAKLTRSRAPTRIEVFADFLQGVEQAFVARQADVMISVVPPAQRLRSFPLARIKMYLVAKRGHPLTRRRVSDRELEEHVLITVRGSDPRLSLGTERLSPTTVVHLNDFHSKKAAITSGVGYGWLPEYLIAAELERGALVKLRWGHPSTTELRPHAYTPVGRELGRAAGAVLTALGGRGASSGG